MLAGVALVGVRFAARSSVHGLCARTISVFRRECAQPKGRANGVVTFACIRAASTSATSDKRVMLDISSDTGRLTLPLSNFTCSFHLPPQKTIGELQKEIEAEDPKLVNKFRLFLDGARVAHTTPFGHVLRDMRAHRLRLLVELAGTTYSVVARDDSMVVEDCNEHAAHNDHGGEVEDYKRAVQHIKRKNPGLTQMPLQEFIDMLHAHAEVHDGDDLRVVRCLHGAKAILHFHKEPSLKDIVFLRPEEVERKMRLSLDAKTPAMIEEEKQQTQRDIALLRGKLVPLDEVKVRLDLKAETFGRRVMWAGLGYALTQLTIIARLTWWELSWDVMEPVSYVLGASNVALFYLFYQLTSYDTSYPSLQEYIKAKRRDALYKKHKFDINRYNEIHRAICILEDKEDEESVRRSMAHRLAHQIEAEHQESERKREQAALAGAEFIKD